MKIESPKSWLCPFKEICQFIKRVWKGYQAWWLIRLLPVNIDPTDTKNQI